MSKPENAAGHVSPELTCCINWRTAKQDNRPKKGWWAPGNYLNQCRLCGCGFIGDKRAGHCADCEYNAQISGGIPYAESDC